MVYSFEPIAQSDAVTLILGSMPGLESLKANQYYAHPRNHFWTIMAELLHFEASASYEKRADALRSARVALWDVLHSCRRQGSLDSAIEAETVVANDFRSFFQCHDKIRSVIFNGAKAEQCYVKHVLPGLDGDLVRYARVPSTSPANASWSYARKLEAWRRSMMSGQTLKSIEVLNEKAYHS